MTPEDREARWAEAYEERAAIMQFDGGLSRQDAERRAGQEIEIARLQEKSERVQSTNRAVGVKAKAMVVEQQKQEQITLPGFEAAFGGG